jgi:hypothetical protein
MQLQLTETHFLLLLLTGLCIVYVRTQTRYFCSFYSKAIAMQKRNRPINRPARQCHVHTAAFTHTHTKANITASSCDHLACQTAQLSKWTDTLLELATTILKVNTQGRDTKFL